MTHKVTFDGKAIVSTKVEYKDMVNCPINKKVLLLTIGGSTVVGEWDGKSFDYDGWHPLPKRRHGFLRRNRDREITHKEYL